MRSRNQHRRAGSVLILGMNFDPEQSGNAPYTSAVARDLARAGHDVTAITAFPHYPQWRFHDEGTQWTERRREGGFTLIRVRHWLPRPPRGIRRLLSEVTFGVRQVMKRWGSPGAVILVSPALVASTICMVRLVLQRAPRRIVWVQDLYSQGMVETGEGGRLAIAIATAIERWTLRRAHVIVAIHRTMARRMVENLDVKSERIQLIGNWSHVTPSALTQDEARAHLGWSRSGFIALHAGNQGRKQGLANVVRAARLAETTGREIGFVLLGDGAERAALESYGQGASRLQFINPLPSDEFPIALAAADVLLINELPGVRAMAAPSKLTSYFAAGRPVIAAGEPDGIVAATLRESGAGVSVASGDPDALLHAVEVAASDAQWCAAAGAAAADYWRSHLSATAALAAWNSVIAQATKTDQLRD